MHSLIFLLLISLASVVSCQEIGTTSELKYLKMSESEVKRMKAAYEKHKDKLLINHIFNKDKWDITYYIDPDCDLFHALPMKSAVGEAISQGIALWLEPLGGAGNIVSPEIVKERENIRGETEDIRGKKIVENFGVREDENHYTIRRYANTPNIGGAGHFIKRSGGGPLLAFFIYCGKDNPNTSKSGKGGGFFVLSANGAEIHIYLPSHKGSGSQGGRWEEKYVYTSCSPILTDSGVNTGLSKLVILHELGHAFGLLDTYSKPGMSREEDLAQRKKIEDNQLLAAKPLTMPDVGDLAIDPRNPRKTQRPSIMSCNIRYDERGEYPMLDRDDIDGIKAVFTEDVEKFSSPE